MTGLHDDTPCELGEGPLWHPGRGQLFWFDILGRRLLTREDGRTRSWRFDAMVSAGLGEGGATVDEFPGCSEFPVGEFI